MDITTLKSTAKIDRNWSSAALNSFDNADLYVDKLYQLASDNQWQTSEMDWSRINLSSISKNLRQATADLFGQLHYGEITALLGSARMVQIAPNHSVRLFSSIQTADEGRHMQWFATLMSKLDCETEILPTTQALMEDVYACDSLEEMVVGMHIIIEGMAHALFLEGAKAFSRLGPFRYVLGDSYASAKQVFSNWLPNFIAKDEGRHLAFGINFLRERLKDMPFKRRQALENKVHRWGELYKLSAQDPKMLAVPGLDSKAIYLRTTQKINQHLRLSGLATSIDIGHE